MKEIYDGLDRAILDAVAVLYVQNEEITLEESKINGAEVPWHVYAAIRERIKFNANLQGEPSSSRAKSRVMLEVEGKPKNFDVHLLDRGGLKLMVKKGG
ncbi:MAG: hypothetical protein ACYTHN_06595 [Planctomycetota bacterium]|jgi:hypothetical protein